MGTPQTRQRAHHVKVLGCTRRLRATPGALDSPLPAHPACACRLLPDSGRGFSSLWRESRLTEYRTPRSLSPLLIGGCCRRSSEDRR